MHMEIFSFLWILLSLFCLITRQFVCCAHGQFVECNASDGEALLDFKNGVEDSENKLSSWRGSNCCLWWGIACDNTTGAVTKVDLHNPSIDSSGRYGFWKLGGEIRPSLAKLNSLKHLDLSFNSILGPIPDFLSSLENLQYLNLSQAGFSGAIPPNLGNLSTLQVFDLSSSFPIYLAVNNLDWIAGLVLLKYLAMDGIDLSMAGIGWVEALNKLPFLTELHLSRCALSNFIYSLPSVNFTSLAVIDLSDNCLNSELPNWFVNISSLVFIGFSSNCLYGRIPLGFNELPSLQSLKLDNNNLSASCFKFFMGSWEKIQVLDLAFNKLHGRLPNSLGNITSLIYVDLVGSGINGGIPSSIGRLCELQYIEMSGNNLTEGFPEFLDETEKCPSNSPLPSLQGLRITESRLGGMLPKWLGQLKNLFEVHLFYNSLQDPIPDSIGNLQQLVELTLTVNNLNGSLPEGLGLLSNLFSLDVSFNKLTGVISESHFARLSKLKILLLSANSFTLNISSNWVPPFQVFHLNMGSCRLGPLFPAWLSCQQAIQHLDFSNASISGSIPNWFWDMSGHLNELNVSFNHVQGHLPNPLNTSPNAHVDFSNNLFEGPIPFPNITISLLDLSNNHFSGPIREKIGQILPNLVFLSLARNLLTGTLPSSMGEMSEITIIDLSRNNLMESIPSSIANCSSLFVLDLHNNNFSGEIPSSLGQLKFYFKHFT